MSLSVIIPTKNRAETLFYTIQTVINQDDSIIKQIIVSDNLSTDNTREVINSFNDYRIKYIRPPQRLGMSEHWEFALSHINTEWVCIIGDDDGLTPFFTNLLHRILKKSPCKAISTKQCSYKWPDQKYGHGFIKYNNINEIRSTKKYISSLIKGKISHKELPWIYTGGIVHKDIINTIKNKTGDFFLSIIPDIYSVFAISSVLDKYYYTDYPLFIGGTSKYSTGQSQMKPKNNTIFQEFLKENNKLFLPFLGNGNIQSLPMLYYESYLQSSLLRDWGLKVNIEDIIVLTLCRAKKENFYYVNSYCKKLSTINGLNYNNILIKYKLKSFTENYITNKRKEKSNIFIKKYSKNIMEFYNSISNERFF
ncbi:glycosyltransferase family 2 protein [Fodinicurvata sediminis]|uniref:glycosyltransferase family 2 protein n=1 Tax=Fodinicurvata sediminis TaxID=1121832 RepID=UPI0003F79BCC|nr:glycosyltransferase family A protein [Fodinicurvata sediminis]